MTNSSGEVSEIVKGEIPRMTGLTLNEWTLLTRMSGPREKAQRAAWLRSEFGLGRAHADLIANRA